MKAVNHFKILDYRKSKTRSPSYEYFEKSTLVSKYLLNVSNCR